MSAAEYITDGKRWGWATPAAPKTILPALGWILGCCQVDKLMSRSKAKSSLWSVGHNTQQARPEPALDKTSGHGRSCAQTLYAKQTGPVWWNLTSSHPGRDVRIFVTKASAGMVRIV